MILNRILALLIGYCFGLILFGYAYSKAKKEDITTKGSGNVGTTNTFRVYGWKAGVFTMIGDLSKPMLAILLTWLIFKERQSADALRLLMIYAGFGAILGHNFPFYKKFKGGKGIACTAGFVIVLFPLEVPIGLLALGGAFLLTGYVSLGSILGVISVFLQTIIFGEMGMVNVTETYKMEVYGIIFVMMAMAIIRHRANIKRLLNGTENKFNIGKKKS
ncbi:MAG: glycerol-3-phosphate 1-O-acyltransferase PlsY [Lachnospiraceae bacterium]|nr:glycerol-3-phosphate 1-O-acyltransferase PlsY [Lachnospiraceae bacterium]